MIGQTISHYKILEKLGEGGMGVVYKARDLKLRRLVALKFLARRADNGGATRQLIEEARAAAALDHPNICTVYEIGEADGRVFIAMAFLEGAGLDDLIAAGTLTTADAVRIAIQIARSLAEAHARGIVHRDVKSGNVMVDTTGRARLMDFGLAARTAPSGVAANDPGKGTPAYMSPEQLLRQPFDGRADVWSWGVVLYEMLTGRLPFSDASPRALVQGILREDPPSPCDLRADLAPELGSIALRALVKDPGARYSSAADALRDLERFERRHVREAAAAAGTPPSVAVLAFHDLSSDHDQGHLCEGIADQIIRDLAQVDGLEVAPRTSTFALRDREIGVCAIGERLRVSSVVEGSVRRSNDRLRITAELKDAADGHTLWSESYDRDVRDVFAVEEEIAREIARALEVDVDAGLRSAGRPASRDIEAYDYYLRGRQFFYRSNRRGIECAIEMFKSATGRDARYASAWAGLADCHSYLFMYHGGDPADLAAAEAASSRALELGPQLAESHTARAFALSLRGRYDEAEARFEEAVRLNPKLFEAWYFRARMYYAQGALDRAARMFEEASRVNPNDFQSAALLGLCLHGLGLPRRAEVAYLRALEKIERHLRLNPDDARAIYLGGDCLVKTGHPERGLERVEKALRLEPDDPYIVYGGACVFALIGRRDDALRWLDKAVSAGFAHREWLERDTDFESIRDDPRFQALVDRLQAAGRSEPAPEAQSPQ